MRTRCRFHRRRGNVLVLSAVMMVMLMGVLAFAIDVGYLLVARVELQRTADAAAIAAAWELFDDDVLTPAQYSVLSTNARQTAGAYAALNPVLHQPPGLHQDDVTIGYMSNPADRTQAIDTSGNSRPNTVSVRVRRTAVQNGEVPFFFAQFLGMDRASAEAEATAALVTDFNGFQTPSDGGHLGILPFALDVGTWNDMLAGNGTDDWQWDEQLQEVRAGGDGILEMNLYPQGTGSPGNRGTVDIGSSNNSTNDIARQITDGVSPSDMEHHGGKLEFDDHGELQLNGDTGISAGVKDELQSIIGDPRIVPIFESVAGPGNNAEYVITKFAGIRILEVKLTGQMSGKRVIIQPAPMIIRGGIPSTTTGQTQYVYSPVSLVR